MIPMEDGNTLTSYLISVSYLLYCYYIILLLFAYRINLSVQSVKPWRCTYKWDKVTTHS
jgi:hypothetical protein